MDEATFRKELAEKGYEPPAEFVMGPNGSDEEHVHDFDVYALVVEGELTIEKKSGDKTCEVGETVRYPAGESHVEKAGPDGVKALVGRRRHPA